jgi:hypothetical protein
MNARQMGHRGGLSRSEAKRAAARQNGARGGRPRNIERFAREVRELQARLQPRLPDIDPHDLNLILACLHKPPGRRLIFMYPILGGGHAF